MLTQKPAIQSNMAAAEDATQILCTGEPGAQEQVLIFRMKVSKKQVARPSLMRPDPLGDTL